MVRPGLVWLHGFNHEEAIVCFEKTLQLDASCVMAQWGIAHAIGPNDNKLCEFFSPEEKSAALHRAHLSLKQAAAEAIDHAKLLRLARPAALN